MRTHSWAVFAVLAITAGGCGGKDSMVCANQPSGWCRAGTYCWSDGRFAGCKPIPTDPKLCGPEAWPGECRAGSPADGGDASGHDASTESHPAPPESGAQNGGAGGESSGGGGAGGFGDGPVSDARRDGVDTRIEQADALPSWDAAMDRSITPPVDVGPACTNQCSAGQTRCQAGALQTCTSMGACNGWGTPATCTGSMTCRTEGGVSRCDCQNECTVEGARQCGAGGGVRLCERAGLCLRLSAEAPCPVAEGGERRCLENACRLSCRSGFVRCGDQCAGARSTFESGTTEGWAINQMFRTAVSLRAVGPPDYPVRSGSRALVCYVETTASDRVVELNRPLCDLASGVGDLAGRRVTAFVQLNGLPVPPDSECSLLVEGTTRFSFGAAARNLTANGWFQVGGAYPDLAEDTVRPATVGVTCMVRGDWEGLLLIDDFQVE